MRKGWLHAGLEKFRPGSLRKEQAETASLQRSDDSGEPESGLVRLHFLFGGRVQCVGFRYRSLYLAQECGVTGWVCNLEDGRVEMEVQGTAEQLARFRLGLYELPGVEIETCEEEAGTPVQKEKTYRVRG